MSHFKAVTLQFGFALLFFATTVHAVSAQSSRKSLEYPEEVAQRVLKGKIIEGRYYDPKDSFSCKVVTYGSEYCLIQEDLEDNAFGVCFFSLEGDFTRVVMGVSPDLEKDVLETNVKYSDGGTSSTEFFSFQRDDEGYIVVDKLPISKMPVRETWVKNASKMKCYNVQDDEEGQKLLLEKLYDDDLIDGEAFFFFSIKKSIVLGDPSKQRRITRAYMRFREKDTLGIICSQKVTPEGCRHNPKRHLKGLKKNLVEFRKTLKLESASTTVAFKSE